MSKQLGSAIREKIIQAYADLGSAPVVARRTGVGTSTVYRVLHEAGIPTLADAGQDWRRHERRRRFDDATERRIAERYAAGESSSSLAAEFDCIPATIRQMVRRCGKVVSPRGNRFHEFSDDAIGKMIRLNSEGMAQASIAAEFGVSQPVISRVLRAAGVAPRPSVATGARHGLWRGGRTLDGSGYVLLRIPPDHEYASMLNRQGYVLEHRLVMAQKLGRVLYPHETVHHIDGDRQNNAPENLELHVGRHAKGASAQHCPTCTCFAHTEED